MMAEERRTSGQALLRNDAKNPWRFLTALDGNHETDRQLVSVTRRDEIQILSHMVAASRVSILYAFSGNGKTSLISSHPETI